MACWGRTDDRRATVIYFPLPCETPSQTSLYFSPSFFPLLLTSPVRVECWVEGMEGKAGGLSALRDVRSGGLQVESGVERLILESCVVLNICIYSTRLLTEK